ncbi:MAG: Gfo/Idh/MocA family oxidoreductase [Caldilineaceae bacterium]|nr:Gfo/Idh/MocA family oxidoreductase [Caldilineaceae bacterium]
MSKTYRVGIIGFAHMHINSLIKDFGAHPQVELVACADTQPARPELRDATYTRGWNQRHALDVLGVPNAFDSYQEMLTSESFDIILCCAENARHAEVTEACAAAGIHVVAEKPMANSLAHGLRMARAAQAAGTEVIINWPTTWSPAIRKAKALIDDGAIGRVLEVKWRGGHTGPLGMGETHPGITQGAEAMNPTELGATWWHHNATGGGAMLDYCCYGSMLSRWYIGEQAQAAVGMRANLNSSWGDADDNAAMIVRFPHALALLEASWTTRAHGVSPGPIVYGTQGTLIIERKEQQVVRLETGKEAGKEFALDALPSGRATIAEELIHHLDTGDDLHPTLQLGLNLEVMAILDAGVRAADSGQLEMVNNGTWQMGENR